MYPGSAMLLKIEPLLLQPFPPLPRPTAKGPAPGSERKLRFGALTVAAAAGARATQRRALKKVGLTSDFGRAGCACGLDDLDFRVRAAPGEAKSSAQPGAPAAQADGDGYNYKVFPDGSRYEGQWKDGLKHGKGRFIYPDGDVYDGEWQDGKAHGHGTYTSKQSKYVGEWQSDLKHGQAVEEWDDTSKYTGTYSHGQKHGKGRFEWPDGSVYDGEFRNNNVEGEGTFTWKDGRQYKGQWVDNRMHGEGRYEWPDGRAYEGQYINDLKEGEGTFLWADGTASSTALEFSGPPMEISERASGERVCESAGWMRLQTTCRRNLSPPSVVCRAADSNHATAELDAESAGFPKVSEVKSSEFLTGLRSKAASRVKTLTQRLQNTFVEE